MNAAAATATIASSALVGPGLDPGDAAQEHQHNDGGFHFPAHTNVDERHAFGLERHGAEEISSKGKAKHVAAMCIQRVYRGYVTRDVCRGMKTRILGGPAIRAATERLVAWHLGWTRILMHVFVFAIYIVTAKEQVFSAEPVGLDTNQAAAKRAKSFDGYEVYKPQDVIGYIRLLLEGMYSGSDTSLYSADCINYHLQYCASIEQNRTIYDLMTEECPSILTRNVGYLDQSNRVLDLVVVQTRRTVVPCKPSVVNLDPFRYVSSNCSSDTEEDVYYRTDECDLSKNCTNYQSKDPIAYTYNPLLKGFSMSFSLGGNNKPLPAILCRFSRYKSWFDDRTKDVSIMRAVLNIEGSAGRVVNTIDRFEFLQGGNNLHIRTIKSTPLDATATYGAMQWTTAMIALALATFLYDITSWTGIRGFTNLVCARFAHIISLLAILFACSAYLYWYEHASSLVVPSINVTDSINELNRFAVSIATLNDIINAFVVLKTMTVVALLALLYRTFVLLSFHSRTSIVSRILVRSLHDLTAFFFIFVLVVSTYAFAGVVFFGSDEPEFGAFFTAVNRLLLLALGEIQDGTYLMFPNYADRSAKAVLSGFYFWSYIALVTVVLMSVLLSIIVRSFLEISSGIEERARSMLGMTKTFLVYCEFQADFFTRNVTKVYNVCCCRPKTKGVSKVSKWDMLLAIRQKYSATGATPAELRIALDKVFSWDKRIGEKVLNFVRRETRGEGWRVQSFLLRGNDPNSCEVQARQMMLTKELMRRTRRHPSVSAAGSPFIKPIVMGMGEKNWKTAKAMLEKTANSMSEEAALTNKRKMPEDEWIFTANAEAESSFSLPTIAAIDAESSFSLEKNHDRE